MFIPILFDYIQNIFKGRELRSSHSHFSLNHIFFFNFEIITSVLNNILNVTVVARLIFKTIP